MTDPQFWNSQEEAQKVVAEVKLIKNVLAPLKKVTEEVEEFAMMAELIEMEEDQEQLLLETDQSWQALSDELDKVELFSFLSGKSDCNDAIVTVHAGAGGT